MCCSITYRLMLVQGILKGEVSLYHWPPVWLVWNQLYDNWQFLQKRLIQTSQTLGQQYSDTSPFSIPWLVIHKDALSHYHGTKVLLNRQELNNDFHGLLKSFIKRDSARNSFSGGRMRLYHSIDGATRESFMKGKAQYSWPPCTN